MTPEQETVLIIKGTIADMDPAMREKVEAHYQELRKMISVSPMATLAIALIGAELAAQ